MTRSGIGGIPTVFGKAARLGLKPRMVVGLLGLQLLATLFEGIGLGLLLPVFQFIQAGGDLAKLTADSELWRRAAAFFQSVGIGITLPMLLVTSFVAILARQGLVYVRLIYTAQTRHGIVRSIRQAGFEALVHARLEYQEGKRQGGIVNDFTVATDLSVAGIFALVSLCGVTIVFAFYTAVLLALSPVMTIVALTIFGLGVAALRRSMVRTKTAGARIAAVNQELGSHLVERIRSMRLIRLVHAEQHETAIINRLTTEQYDQYLSRDRRRAEVSVALEPLIVAFGMLSLYLGVTRFGVTIEEIGLFILVVLRLVPLLKEAMLNRQGVLACQPSLELVEHRLSTLDQAREPAGGDARLDRLTDSIRIEGVSFSYAGGEEIVPALSDVTLTIPAGRMTALVGPSGSGKSTLVDLLPRLRQRDSGRITYDDVPVEDIDLHQLRRAIAFVPQAAEIFGGSIADHIRYGNPTASMNDVREAAAVAGATEFIGQLPGGYDAPVGEAGVRLSGGQRQRLDLARALVQKAPILILDEPTSQLDADAEALFREALKRIIERTKLTVIVIGHRLSTVAMAHQIVVLERGRISEVGTHAGLLKSGGWYARATAKQSGYVRRATAKPKVFAGGKR